MNSVGNSDLRKKAEKYLPAIRLVVDDSESSYEEATKRIAPLELHGIIIDILNKEQSEIHTFYPAISSKEDENDNNWFESWDPSDGYHWPRFRNYLISSKGRTLPQCENLDNMSDAILSLLGNPMLSAQEQFDVRGLVLGRVQSGKTENFTALIAKAADAGYHLVIVLSGVDKVLRQQTQLRLSSELGIHNMGIGLPDDSHKWISFTDTDLEGDFDPGSVDASVLNKTNTVIMVVKKQKNRLQRLSAWLKGKVPSDLPVLVIDDEADQASINISPLEDEEGGSDPSAINSLIREILGHCKRVSFVAYTATPFANILIPTQIDHQRVGKDLFPRDFIVNLQPGMEYIGANDLFGGLGDISTDQGEDEMPIIEFIDDWEANIFSPRGQNSLHRAILDWIIATAAKDKSLGEGISTMLIHISHNIITQNTIRDFVEDIIIEVRNSWRFGSNSANWIGYKLEDRWNNNFRPILKIHNKQHDCEFSDLRPYIDELFKQAEVINILTLNSKSPDQLDYKANPTLKAILIGGNKLARGVTLEGLLVSFFTRKARNYDTLLQMARWFGYRRSYVDLTRLYTTTELFSNFRHLALVEEELRNQIEFMCREKYKPDKLALFIRNHPAMLVTAENRMGRAERITQSYSGQLIQTTRFPLNDIRLLEENLEATRNLFRIINDPENQHKSIVSDTKPIWTNVDYRQIVEFLKNYNSIQNLASFDSSKVANYIYKMAKNYSELLNWTISVRCSNKMDTKLGSVDLGIRTDKEIPCIMRSAKKSDDQSIGALINPAQKSGPYWSGDEEIGLTKIQIDNARSNSRNGNRLGDCLRKQRDPTDGLLLIYPISKHSAPTGKAIENRKSLFDDINSAITVIGIALVFPFSENFDAVEYIVNNDLPLEQS